MFPLKHALRSLFKNPGFTLIAVLTIAIGIGANTALFSIFDRLVLRPIDLPDSGSLVRVWTNNPDRNILGPVSSVPKYEFFREHQQSFASITASNFSTHTLTRDGGEAEQLNTITATASWIPTLGLQLARGRNFTKEEDTLGGPPVVILAYDVWKNKFGARESMVGETINLNGVAHVVVGILQERLGSPMAGTQAILPRPLENPTLTAAQLQNGAGYLQITARLKRGVTLAQADAEIHTLMANYRAAFPSKQDISGNNELHTWNEELVGSTRQIFYLLLVAVAFVLLIACANVSNLFLSRLTARHKEIAVRLSLGATRAQLIRQFLTETTVFSVIATALGIFLSIWSLDVIKAFLANQLPPDTEFSLSGLTLAFTVAISAVTALVIGLVPAWQASKTDIAEVLKDTARGAAGGVKGVRTRSVLIVVEVVLSVILLIGSGLLLLSFVKLQSTPPGFRTTGVGSAYVSIPNQRYQTATQQADYFNQVVEKLKSYPQVKQAAATFNLPLTGGSGRILYSVHGQTVVPLAKRPIADMCVVTEDYFATLQVALRAGRLFTPLDRQGAPDVAIINESLAKRLFPGESAVGKILIRGSAEVKVEIVGVTADMKTNGLNVPPVDQLYIPLRQFGRTGMALIAQTDGDPNLLQSLMRSAVAAVDSTQAISFFSTMDSALQQSFGVQRIVAWLTGVFAGVALLLSAIGLYSVLAYAVTQRTSEIGIRMALGAQRNQVVNLILSQGMKLVALGLVIGLVLAAAGGRLLSSMLYQVEPLNLLVFGGVSLLFVIVAAVACLLPSLRAARVDPIIALRTE